jgi:NADPH2:quinone reductase
MRAMRADAFGGVQSLKLVNIPEPELGEGKVLVRMKAAGVTPLEHTILTGHMPAAKAPQVMGGEGAGIVEKGGGAEFPDGTRVMFTGTYGIFDRGVFCEVAAIRKGDLCRLPDTVPFEQAAGMPVAYLTAELALQACGFAKGKTVVSPAIGGSIGNAVTQLARAKGARHAISTTTNPAKARQAGTLGFHEVIDLSTEKLAAGVTRVTHGHGTDVLIDGIGGEVLSEALSVLAMGAKAITLGYSAGRKSTIDVTHLIWKRASLAGFSLFSYPPEAIQAAWTVIMPLLEAGAIQPIVARAFPLEEAPEAIRFLVEDRPFGRVILTM